VLRQGFDIVAIRAVAVAIGAGSVRYYFPGDRRAALTLANSYNRQLAAVRPRIGSPRDFGHYAPKPQPGTVEIWIGSR
jgi:hypothetical protein